MAAYERYRATLKSDAEGRTNFEYAQSQRFIVARTPTNAGFGVSSMQELIA